MYLPPPPAALTFICGCDNHDILAYYCRTIDAWIFMSQGAAGGHGIVVSTRGKRASELLDVALSYTKVKSNISMLILLLCSA